MIANLQYFLMIVIQLGTIDAGRMIITPSDSGEVEMAELGKVCFIGWLMFIAIGQAYSGQRHSAIVLAIIVIADVARRYFS
jgi:hypothetical protein